MRQPLEGFRIQLAFAFDVLRLNHLRQACRKTNRWRTVHDFRIVLDEAPIAVPGKAGIAGQPDQRANALRIEADIKNGRQHARHGLCRARADRDEKGRAVAAETAAGRLLQAGDPIAQPLVERREGLRIVPMDRRAKLGRHDKRPRHAHPPPFHLPEHYRL